EELDVPVGEARFGMTGQRVLEDAERRRREAIVGIEDEYERRRGARQTLVAGGGGAGVRLAHDVGTVLDRIEHLERVGIRRAVVDDDHARSSALLRVERRERVL